MIHGGRPVVGYCLLYPWFLRTAWTLLLRVRKNLLDTWHYITNGSCGPWPLPAAAYHVCDVSREHRAEHTIPHTTPALRTLHLAYGGLHSTWWVPLMTLGAGGRLQLADAGVPDATYL